MKAAVAIVALAASTLFVAPAAPITAAGTCGVEGGHVVTVLLTGGISRLASPEESILLDGADCGTGDVVSIFATTGVADRIVIDAAAPWQDGADAMDVSIIGLEPDDSLRVITTREYDFVEMCTTASGALQIRSANEESVMLDLSTESSAAVPVRVDLGDGPDTLVNSVCVGSVPSGRPVSIHGDRGADNLSGGRGRQSLFGGAGTDTLDGGRGDDRLVGGDRADILRGGRGTDSCGCDGLDTVRSIENRLRARL